MEVNYKFPVKSHIFPLLEGVRSQDKSVLMNIDSFTRNVNIKRLGVALPGAKLAALFFRIKLFNPSEYSTGSRFSQLKID